MNKRRLEKFKQVVAQRQPDITVVLENVIDLHNIGAVLRSCDSVGIREIFVLHTEAGLQADSITIGKRTAAGARRWVDVHYYTDAAACFQHVRQYYQRILATYLEREAIELYDLDLTIPAAFLFGNERDGLSEEVLQYANSNFWIPQMGMSESLNISVACAVTLYEALRQRRLQHFYSSNNPLPQVAQQQLLDEYIRRHEERDARKVIPVKK